GCIAGAFGVVIERKTADGSVVASGCVGNKGQESAGRVVDARCVAKKRSIAIGRVCATFSIVKKGERSNGSVLGADCVAQKHPSSGGSIFDAFERAWVSSVRKERPGPDGRVELAIPVSAQ